MTGSKYLTFFCSVAVLASLMMLVAGCETSSSNDDSDDNNLTITPNSMTVSASAVTNIAFTADGGTEPYTWSVNDSSIGAVVGAGNTAVYTAYALAGVNFVILTDAGSNSVSATITQN